MRGSGCDVGKSEITGIGLRIRGFSDLPAGSLLSVNGETMRFVRFVSERGTLIVQPVGYRWKRGKVQRRHARQRREWLMRMSEVVR